eukprot:GHVU01097457.1.p1 GENE.GHVU01097457.1~~GHVU01097457.1.p1  ORF type:complete len:381 (+),score=51.96 GHVU01097457.1:574-1716(+)
MKRGSTIAQLCGAPQGNKPGQSVPRAFSRCADGPFDEFAKDGPGARGSMTRSTSKLHEKKDPRSPASPCVSSSSVLCGSSEVMASQRDSRKLSRSYSPERDVETRRVVREVKDKVKSQQQDLDRLATFITNQFKTGNVDELHGSVVELQQTVHRLHSSIVLMQDKLDKSESKARKEIEALKAQCYSLASADAKRSVRDVSAECVHVLLEIIKLDLRTPVGKDVNLVEERKLLTAWSVDPDWVLSRRQWVSSMSLDLRRRLVTGVDLDTAWKERIARSVRELEVTAAASTQSSHTQSSGQRATSISDTDDSDDDNDYSKKKRTLTKPRPQSQRQPPQDKRSGDERGETEYQVWMVLCAIAAHRDTLLNPPKPKKKSWLLKL